MHRNYKLQVTFLKTSVPCEYGQEPNTAQPIQRDAAWCNCANPSQPHVKVSTGKSQPTSWRNENWEEKEALLCHPGIAGSVHRHRSEGTAWDRCPHPEAGESSARPAGKGEPHLSLSCPAAMRREQGWALGTVRQRLVLSGLFYT